MLYILNFLLFMTSSFLFSTYPFKEEVGFGYFKHKLNPIDNEKESYFVKTGFKLARRSYLKEQKVPLIVENNEVEQEKENFLVVGNNEDKQEGKISSVVGNNEVEEFFENDIQGLTSLAHNPGLQKEYSTENTIPAIPILIPKTSRHIVVDNNEDEQEKEKSLAVDNNEDEKEEETSYAVGENEVEKFFIHGIQDVTFLAHYHDLQEEYLTKNTISAIPILIPEISWGMRFSISPVTSYVADGHSSSYRLCEGIKENISNKDFIKNICTERMDFRYMTVANKNDFIISLATDNFKPKFIKKLKMNLYYLSMSREISLMFPLKKGEKLSALVTNGEGEKRIFNVPSTQVSESNTSVVSELQKEWIKSIKNDAIEDLQEFKESINSTTISENNSIENRTTNENFVKYKDLVIEFCEQKIKTLETQNSEHVL